MDHKNQMRDIIIHQNNPLALYFRSQGSRGTKDYTNPNTNNRKLSHRLLRKGKSPFPRTHHTNGIPKKS